MSVWDFRRLTSVLMLVESQCQAFREWLATQTAAELQLGHAMVKTSQVMSEFFEIKAILQRARKGGGK